MEQNLAEAMEGITISRFDNQQQQQLQSNPSSPTTTISTTSSSSFRRPWDELGPPQDPMPFPPHQSHWGKRASVCCVDPVTQEIGAKENVLFRDFSREFHSTTNNNKTNHNNNHNDNNNNNTNNNDVDPESRIRVAYWPIPNKRIRTIMGHVEICYVLERSQPNGKSNNNMEDRDDDDLEDDDSSDDEEDDDDCEEDVFFVITNRKVAVKVNYYARMERLRDRHAEDPLKEIAAMQLIGNNHPHVLGCDDVLFDGENLNVVMHFCQKGDLFQLLQDSQHQDTPGMSEGRARFWFRQFVSGLEFLHRKAGICHRDLSPENALIDEHGCLIIDFGMCLRVPYLDSQGNRTYLSNGGVKRCLFRRQGACGKLPYMSPEIFRNRDPFDGEAVDIFSSGTILFCMLTGNRSYQQPHVSDAQFYWMTHGLSQLLSDWNVRLSREGLNLLEGMLKIDPRERLSLDEVVHHPWFSYPDDPV